MAALSALEAQRSSGSTKNTAKAVTVKKTTTSGGTPVKKHSQPKATTTKKVGATTVNKVAGKKY